ncbi:glycosyltransferase [Vibrio owensii]|uniref:glycosyltransferase n=1 Tax=Vibrio owensii TaxID=696485 RepID=UPI0018F23A1C|nr:glycosyltransferase [Vibrio owensii]
MRILVFPSWYFTDERPNLGSFFREQSKAISDNGNDVRIAYTEIRNPKYILKDILRKKKIGFERFLDGDLITYRVTQYNIPPRIMPALELRTYLGLKFIVKNLIEKEMWIPDIIHIHSFFPAGYAGMKLASDLKVPFVITEHSTGFSRNYYKSYQLKYLRKILEASSANISVGEGLKNDLQKYTDNEVKIIPNMVDVQFFSANGYSNFKTNSDSFTFFSLGDLTYKKGFDILIDSFFRAFGNNSKFRLKIGGAGEESDNLKARAKNLGLSSQIDFLGPLSREQVAIEMNNSDAFVLASRFETFGVVFIEALACGKPIVVPDIPGPKDIVVPNNGIIFKKGNKEDLADKMLYVVENYSLYDPREIIENCHLKYGKANFVKRITEVYESVLQNRKA